MALISVTKSLNKHLCFPCQAVFEGQYKIAYPNYRVRQIENEEFEHEDFSEEEQRLEPFQHWQSFNELTRSALNGCHMCSMFMSQFTLEERALIENYASKISRKGGLVALGHYWATDTAMYEIQLAYPVPKELFKEQQSKGPSLQLHLQPSQESTCDFQQNTTQVDERSISDTATAWLNDCLRSHEDCGRQDVSRTQRPTRLIAVGIKEDFSDLKLCNTAEIAARSPYVTLSHCWGGRDLVLKLTEASRSEYMRQIPWSMMPETFKDAVIVTKILQKRLGVQYIWIDALCIIQDSVDDWQLESSIMGDIYKHALCNLAACVGGDSTSGLFRERDSFFFHTCMVRAGPMSVMEGSFTVENKESMMHDVETSTLMTRAWVLQELLLARRVLYFTPEQLYFGCHSFCAEEKNPRQTLTCERRPRHITLSGEKDPLGIEDPDDNRYFLWIREVAEYTSRELTRPEDKLVAISGIARQMQADLGTRDEYVAGLWKRYIQLHLLWQVFRLSEARRPAVYRAPTWSWASVDGTVWTLMILSKKSSSLVTVKSDVEYLTEDSFGQVKSAALEITGPMLKVNMREVTTYHGSPHTHKTFVDLHFQSIKMTDCSTMLDIFMPETDNKVAYCMFVIWSETGDGPELIGLLLEKVPGARGRYQRLGVFNIDHRTCHYAMKCATSTWLHEDEYEQACVNGYDKITII